MKTNTYNLGHSRGFTLIELLVVIAIIGILASVVLASLNTARDKGNDAKTKSQVAGFRSAAEIFYDNQTPKSYGGDVVGTEAAGASVGPGCDSGFFADALLTPYTLTGNYPASAGDFGKCTTDGATATGYTMSVKLTAANTYWCVDGTGQSKETNALPADNATACP